MLDDLAAQLRVSRTPVREALSRLATEGLVKPVGSRGLCVTSLTAADLRNLSDLRLVCEPARRRKRHRRGLGDAGGPHGRDGSRMLGIQPFH